MAENILAQLLALPDQPERLFVVIVVPWRARPERFLEAIRVNLKE
jgi:hypothetical protein